MTALNSNTKQQKAHVLPLFGNVPETDLSTTFDHVNMESTVYDVAETNTIDIKWKMGVTKFPMSNSQDSSKSNSFLDDNLFQVAAQQCEKFELVTENQTSKDGKTMENILQKTCEFCGKKSNGRNFMGRFCSKICIGKNVSLARKKRSLSLGTFQQNKKNFNTNSRETWASTTAINGLKLKIHIPTYKKGPKSKFARNARASSIGETYSKRKLVDMMDELLADHKTFNWDTYLNETDSKALGPEEFKAITGRHPYPSKRKRYQVGNYLEAIDPMHQSLICLVYVAQIEGSRMRLHFNGYSSCFDFWVDFDSPFIFEIGFCKKTGRHLNECEKSSKVKPETRETSFSSAEFENTTRFKKGDKIEAVDKTNHDLVCVATVADVVGDYILVHFDGWDKNYDFWANSFSPFIHPVGWCEKNKKALYPPPNHAVINEFVWKEYLKATDSEKADISCFENMNHTFKEGLKLEVVDPRNPILVRVATITKVDDLRIKLHFDGWSSMYDVWMDIDSPDIHPVNWCKNAGYPLHPPVSEENMLKKSCPVVGCSGLGHVNSPNNLKYHKKHYSEYGCPYSPKNIHKYTAFDRFSQQFKKEFDSNIQSCHNREISKQQKQLFNKLEKQRKIRQRYRPQNTCLASSEISHQKNDANFFRSVSKNSLRNHESFNNFHGRSSIRSNMKSNERLIHSSFLSSLHSISTVHLPKRWYENAKCLPGVEGIKASHVMKWNLRQVADFVHCLTGKSEYGKTFEREEIDGEAFLLLTQNEIINNLHVKLGPAVKIFNAILLFKVTDKKF